MAQEHEVHIGLPAQLYGVDNVRPQLKGLRIAPLEQELMDCQEELGILEDEIEELQTLFGVDNSSLYLLTNV